MSTTRHSQRVKHQPKRFEDLPEPQPSTSSQPPVSPEQKSTAKRGRKRKERYSVSEDDFTFERLLDYPSDQSPSTGPTVQTWKKAVDEVSKTIIFYQLDLRSEFPGISRCVRIRPESGDANAGLPATGKPSLVASIFMGDYDLGTEPVSSLLDKDNITTESEFQKVLEFIGSMPVVRNKTGIKRRDMEAVPEQPVQTAAPVVYRTIVRRSGRSQQNLSKVCDPPVEADLNGSTVVVETETLGDTEEKAGEEAVNFYWKHPGPEQTQLLDNHDVYVKNSVLDDLKRSLSTANISSPTAWKSYAWNLTLHLLGDAEGVAKLKRSGKKLMVDQLLDAFCVEAIIEHVRNVCGPAVDDLEDSYKRYCNGLFQQLGMQRKPRATRPNTRARYIIPAPVKEASTNTQPSPADVLIPQELEILGTLQGKALCPIKECSARKYAVADLNFLRRHFQQVHAHAYPSPSFTLLCPVAECATTFGTSMEAFREHLANDHLRPSSNGNTTVSVSDNAFPSGIVEQPHDQVAESDTTVETVAIEA
ncbi:uncharacterized protein LOC129594334 [Paramacrobiotus metropolitanus]|uniref:uncharacterized protein LOC129594334 n=1 Tax=Paramacrobiotus metropolitanus TaxID=2943436 RepID=UPI002445E12C|nr:uncharacterized protein LOC129594334 [Paramacrobiotus metropolitanus]